MKRNIPFLAAAVLTGIFCVWSYLAAQPAGEKESPAAKKSLLEIKEPSQEDFEYCAKRAVDFFESMSADQTQMDIAVHDLFGKREMPPQLSGMSRQLTQIKSDIAFGHLELVAKKSFGENIIALYYHYHTDKWPLLARISFLRTLDVNGEPGHWQCNGFYYTSSVDGFVPASP